MLDIGIVADDTDWFVFESNARAWLTKPVTNLGLYVDVDKTLLTSSSKLLSNSHLASRSVDEIHDWLTHDEPHIYWVVVVLA